MYVCVCVYFDVVSAMNSDCKEKLHFFLVLYVARYLFYVVCDL